MFKVSVTVEVFDKKHLEAVVEALVELVNGQPAATTKVAIAHEVVTTRGKRQIKDSVEIGPGQQIEFDDFAMVADTPIETFLREMREVTTGGGIESVELSAGGRTVSIGPNGRIR